MATITKSIGTNSRDYSTITLWAADLDDGVTYTGSDDAVGECYNDSVFDEGIDICTSAPDAATVTLTAASGEGHDGTAGSGARVVNTSSHTNAVYLANGEITVDGLEFDSNGQAHTYSVYVGQFNRDRTLSNCLVHGHTKSGTMAGIRCAGTSGSNTYIWNNVIYDIEQTSASGILYALWQDVGSTHVFNGNTIDNISSNSSGNLAGVRFDNAGSAHSISNCMVGNCSNAGSGSGDTYLFASTGPSTIQTNAADDANSNASVQSVDTSATYVSTTGGSEDYRLTIDATDLIGAATDLGATYQFDAAGNDRDARTAWTIGAFEGPYTTTSTIGTSARDYSTWQLWDASLDDLIVDDVAVGNCYADSDFNCSNDSLATDTDLTSATLQAADGEEHDGTHTSGGVTFTRTSGSQFGTGMSAANTTVDRWYIRNIIFDWDGVTQKSEVLTVGNNTTLDRCIFVASQDADRTVSNSFAAGTDYFNLIVVGRSGGGNGIRASRGEMYNCTVYGCEFHGIDGTSNVNTHIRNCLSVGNGSNDFHSTSTGTFTTNFSSDSTGNTTTATAADFVSTTSGSEDLHLVSTATHLLGTGDDLTAEGFSLDIDGQDRDAGGRAWDIGADQRPTTITSSIGTTGRDYSTPDLWEADLDDTTIYIENDIAKGECYADSTFAYTGSLVLNGGGTVGLDSYELTAAEAERHDGTAGSGVLFTRTGGADNWFDMNRDGITISWLECDGGYDDSASNRIQRTFDFGSSAQDAFIHHMLVHNCGDTTGYRGVYSVTTDGSSTRGLTIHNNVFYNMSGHANGATIDCTTSGSRLRRIYNNTVHGTASANGIEATNNAYVFCQNNISVSNGGDDFEFLGTSAGAYTYNMSSDNTLPNDATNLESVTVADQFVSTTSGSEDFHLKAGADAINAGTDLGSDYEIDIDGAARTGTWDIGADQYVSAGGAVLPWHYYQQQSEASLEMLYMNVDTAVEVPVNLSSLIDDTDFVTRETAVAYNAAGMDLVWNFVQPDGTITQTAVTPTTAGVHDWTHIGDGMYKIEIPASAGTINNDTEGIGYFTGVCDGVLPWRGPDICFRPAAVNNSMITGTDNLQVDAVEISGDSTAADNLELACDNYSATRGLAGTALPAIASDSAGGIITHLETIDATADAILVDTGTTLPSTLSTIEGKVDTVDTVVDAILVDTGTTLPATLSTIDGNVDAILVDTSTSIPADIAALNDPTAAAIADAVWDEAQADHVAAGSFGLIASEIASIEGKVDTVDGIVDDILIDTAEIGAAGAGLTALATQASVDTVDANVDAILVDTDTTIPGLITGLNDLSAADVNAEVDTALADIHLDHLLAVDYDPASKPGVATALLNELVEDDGGVSRFTINALENAPSGSGASAAAIADAVWDEPRSGHTTAGTFGLYLDAQVSTVGGGSLTAADIADAVWDEAQGDHTTAGSFGEIASEIATIDGIVDDILTDTGTTIPASLSTLSSDVGTVGSKVDTVDTVVDGIAVDLATVDGVVDAILVDTGTTLPATLTTIAGYIDTEIAAILVDTGTTIPALIAGLNNLSAAEVNAEVDSALADYDAPTKAEMDAAFAALNDPSAAAIADAVWDEAQADHTTAGTFGLYLDSEVSGAGGGGGDATEAKQDSIIASLADIQGATFATATDSLEAIRNRGDAAWITAGGVGSPWDALMTDYQVSGTFGARFQEAARYINTAAEIKYVTRGDAYNDTANAKLEWAVTKDFSGWTGLLIVTHRVTGATLLSHAIEVTDATTLKASLDSVDTAFAALTTDAEFGAHPYQVVMTDGTDEQTPVPNGSMVIAK